LADELLGYAKPFGDVRVGEAPGSQQSHKTCAIGRRLGLVLAFS
jgi:hypothetical protein